VGSATRKLALACMVSVVAARAQAPTVQDLETKLLEFEEESQKTIAELKAQIAACNEGKGLLTLHHLRHLRPRRPKFQSYILRKNSMASKPGPD
jgi:hypothetical protein